MDGFLPDFCRHFAILTTASTCGEINMGMMPFQLEA